jgi:SAM-dependent methyltransferase
MEFAPFDQRGYPTLPVRDGYAAWARTYESVVQDEMDLRLLERVQDVDWAGAGRALDLACGTGRTGAWLRQRGVRRLDGVDFTPDMLRQARAKAVYDRLIQADVTATGLEPGGYDLLVLALADEHIKDLGALYGEASRLAAPKAAFVLVGYHPHFLMLGVPTHFNGDDGRPVAVESYVHLTSDHVTAALGVGWRLAAMDEGVIDDAWIAKKPKWERYRSHPVSFSLVWRRP